MIARLLIAIFVLLACGCGAERSDPVPAYRHETVVLERPSVSESEDGSLVSPVLERDEPFSEAIVSWNIAYDTGGRVEARVRQATGAWTRWLRVGVFGEHQDGTLPVREDGPVRVDVDYIVSSEPLDAIQWRVVSATGEASVDRVAVCFTSRDGSRTTDDIETRPSAARVRLDVPFRNQYTDREELAGRLCSPASTSMVLAYRGVDCGVGRVASKAHDQEFDLYGNWPRNVQAAYELGVPGYVTRFDDWREVEALLSEGQPIIASIRAEEGELRGAPYDSTGGHLIVLRGLDSRGDLFVSDPAVRDAAVGELVYRRADLTRVWLGRGKGTAYILLPTEPTGG